MESKLSQVHVMDGASGPEGFTIAKVDGNEGVAGQFEELLLATG